MIDHTIECPRIVLASELQLGDTVRISPLPFSDAKVMRITDVDVTLFRPYVVTSDFECSEGEVIPYTGFEEYNLSLTKEVTLLSRACLPIR
jgi:hypothetical protein